MSKCPRCKAGKLQRLPESTWLMGFYECSQCKWHFAKKPWQRPHDRWLSPISLVLYGIIFEKDPRTRIVDIADSFSGREDNKLRLLIEEIDRELEKPTQKVSHILDLVYSPSEAIVREFLHGVNERMKRTIELRKHTQRDNAS